MFKNCSSMILIKLLVSHPDTWFSRCPFQVKWTKDGEAVDLSDPLISTEVNAGVCSLEVALCTRQSAGIYVCTATNHLGRDQTRCKVVVEGNALSNVTPLQIFKLLCNTFPAVEIFEIWVLFIIQTEMKYRQHLLKLRRIGPSCA